MAILKGIVYIVSCIIFFVLFVGIILYVGYIIGSIVMGLIALVFVAMLCHRLYCILTKG